MKGSKKKRKGIFVDVTLVFHKNNSYKFSQAIAFYYMSTSHFKSNWKTKYLTKGNETQ